MNNARYYQEKRKAEANAKKVNEPKKEMSEDEWYFIYFAVGFLTLIIGLFILQWNALEDGLIECEKQGGTWYSRSTGKVTITECEFKE